MQESRRYRALVKLHPGAHESFFSSIPDLKASHIHGEDFIVSSTSLETIQSLKNYPEVEYVNDSNVKLFMAN